MPIPPLPAEPPGAVTFAVIGDVHAQWEFLDSALAHIREQPEIAGVLMVGDFGGDRFSMLHGNQDALDAYFQTVREVLTRVFALQLPVAWVPGNHDVPDLREVNMPGNVDQGVVEIAGTRIAGIGGAGPAKFGFGYEWDEDDIRARDVPAAEILLCHAPPINTPLDGVAFVQRHAGSAAIRERAENHTGVLLCGHIHESAGACIIGNCLCMNVGALGEPYGRPQAAFIRRLPDGNTIAMLDDLSNEERYVWQGPAKKK